MSRKDRKFNRFFRQKLGDLQKKKKKVFAKIQSDFSAEIQNSNVFSAQIQVISKKKKKKGLRQNSRRFFFQNFASSNVSGGALFAWGGLFSIFHRKSASKAQKTCDFVYFTSQWGGLEPPPPPPGYATAQGVRKSSGVSASSFGVRTQKRISLGGDPLFFLLFTKFWAKYQTKFE